MPVVDYALDEHVATITLNRPEAMNALSREVSLGLRDAFQRFRDEEQARVAIVTGAGGRAFSAGADLKEMSARRGAPGTSPTPPPVAFEHLFDRRADQFGGAVWKPVIAAIDGYCLAGGLELALTCDIRVASEQSKFGLTEVTRGIIAAGGGIQRLPRAVPLAVAMELLLTGRHMDATEALRWGLVSRVVSSDQLLPTAREIAAMIAANGPLAVRATKQAAMRGLDVSLEEGLRIEAVLSQIVTQSEDAREGPRAFAEKRPPRYVGR